MFKYYSNILIFILSFVNPTTAFSTHINVNNNKLHHTSKNTLIMNHNQELCPEYLYKFTKYLNQDQSEFVVKKVSSTFPEMDSISHYVLHTNDILINTVLNTDCLKLETKKMLVLFLVEFTQNGDATGTHILQMYHDLVNCLL